MKATTEFQCEKITNYINNHMNEVIEKHRTATQERAEIYMRTHNRFLENLQKKNKFQRFFVESYCKKRLNEPLATDWTKFKEKTSEDCIWNYLYKEVTREELDGMREQERIMVRCEKWVSGAEKVDEMCANADCGIVTLDHEMYNFLYTLP